MINAVQQALYGEIGLQLLQQGVLSAMVAFLTYSIAIKRLGLSLAATLLVSARAAAGEHGGVCCA